MISCRGGGILSEGAELDTNCCFPNSSSWLKPNFHSIFFFETQTSWLHLFFSMSGEGQSCKCQNLEWKLVIFPKKLTSTAYPKPTSSGTELSSQERRWLSQRHSYGRVFPLTLAMLLSHPPPEDSSSAPRLPSTWVSSGKSQNCTGQKQSTRVIALQNQRPKIPLQQNS